MLHPGRYISISGKFAPAVYGSTLQAMMASPPPTTSSTITSANPDRRVLDGALDSTPSATMMAENPHDALTGVGAAAVGGAQPLEETATAHGGAVTVGLVNCCSGDGGEGAETEMVGDTLLLQCCGLCGDVLSHPLS